MLLDENSHKLNGSRLTTGTEKTGSLELPPLTADILNEAIKVQNILSTHWHRLKKNQTSGY